MINSPMPDAALFAAAAQFRQCRTAQEVGALLATAIAPFGLRNYAIGGMPTPADPNPTGFMFHNWPEAWHKLYFERNFGPIDPVPRAAMTATMPLTVGEMRAGKAGFLPGPETDEYFAMAEELVGGKGLVVPIRGPHGYHGIVALIGPSEDFTDEDRVRLHMLALYAHDRLLELHGRTVKPNGVQLSAREVEVMRQALSGMGDEAIGHALGISARTVRFHFENARHKLGVKTRAEALVTAAGLHLLGS